MHAAVLRNQEILPLTAARDRFPHLSGLGRIATLNRVHDDSLLHCEIGSRERIGFVSIIMRRSVAYQEEYLRVI